MTCDQVIDIALELPDTAIGVKPKQVAVNRAGKGMIWTIEPTHKKLLGYQIKEDDACVLALHVTWEKHDELLESPGTVFWKRPHYIGYPALLVDTSDLDEDSARLVAQVAWEAAGQKTKVRRNPSS